MSHETQPGHHDFIKHLRRWFNPTTTISWKPVMLNTVRRWCPAPAPVNHYCYWIRVTKWWRMLLLKRDFVEYTPQKCKMLVSLDMKYFFARPGPFKIKIPSLPWEHLCSVFLRRETLGTTFSMRTTIIFLWWVCNVHHGSRTFIENAMRLHVCTPGSYESLLSLNWPREMMRNHDGDVAAAWMSHD